MKVQFLQHKGRNSPRIPSSVAKPNAEETPLFEQSETLQVKVQSVSLEPLSSPPLARQSNPSEEGAVSHIVRGDAVESPRRRGHAVLIRTHAINPSSEGAVEPYWPDCRVLPRWRQQTLQSSRCRFDRRSVRKPSLLRPCCSPLNACDKPSILEVQ